MLSEATNTNYKNPKDSNIKNGLNNNLKESSIYYELGTQYGHLFQDIRYYQWHPFMSSSILGLRNGRPIISAQVTLRSLCRAFFLISHIFLKNGNLLIVNTNPKYTKLCNKLFKQKNSISSSTSIKKKGISYCFHKWIGGTLTNYDQISKSIYYFMMFKKLYNYLRKNRITKLNFKEFPKYKRIRKSLKGYMNRELINKNNSINRYSITLSGKPDIILCMNPQDNLSLINEAYRLNIPVIALVEPHINIKKITYPIPCNNNSYFLNYYILKKILLLTLATARQ